MNEEPQSSTLALMIQIQAFERNGFHQTANALKQILKEMLRQA